MPGDPMQGNGSYCPVHGAYFGWVCSGCNPSPPAATAWTNPYDFTLQRIASALERIADALTQSDQSQMEHTTDGGEHV